MRSRNGFRSFLALLTAFAGFAGCTASLATHTRALAQMELRTWLVTETRTTNGGDACGLLDENLSIGESLIFDNGCGFEYLRGELRRNAASIVLDSAANAGYADIYLRLNITAGSSGAHLRITPDGFGVSSPQPAQRDGSYLLAPNALLVVTIIQGTGGHLTINAEGGSIASVVSDGEWCAQWTPLTRTEQCNAPLCRPSFASVPYPGCMSSASLVKNADETLLLIDVQTQADGAALTVTGTYEVLVPSCVTCVVQSHHCGTTAAGFAIPPSPFGASCQGVECTCFNGKVMLQPGIYSFTVGGTNTAGGKIELHFTTDECGMDCDNDGNLEVNEFAWGWETAADDVNSNGILDYCERRHGDFDLDGTVSASDYSLLLSMWGSVAAFDEHGPSDPSGDNWINASDLAILCTNWGTGL